MLASVHVRSDIVIVIHIVITIAIIIVIAIVAMLQPSVFTKIRACAVSL